MLLNINYIKKWISAVFIIIMVIISVYSVLVLMQDEFYNGISVEDADLSGLTIQQAKIELKESINDIYSKQEIIIKGRDNTFKINMNDISLNFLTDEAVLKAYNEGRKGNVIKRLFKIVSLNFHKKHIKCGIEFDGRKLYDILKIIKKQTDRQENNASVSYINGNIKKTKEVMGSKLDLDINYEIVKENIIRRNFQNIQLVYSQTAPRITYEDIKDIEGLLSEYETFYNTGSLNRSHNITIACRKIDNYILLPGEEFSMNRALGPRTLENGYKEAPIILNNDFIKDAGGGVCQVTTTLYCSVLKSRLKIIERAPHSLPLAYVPPGQDATIAGEFIDLKFKNNRDYAICIDTKAENGMMNIKILGKNEGKIQSIKLRSKIIEEYEPGKEVIIDNTIPIDKVIVVKKPIKGMKVRVYRDCYDEYDQLVESEFISEDNYYPVNEIIKVNENYEGIEEMENSGLLLKMEM